MVRERVSQARPKEYQHLPESSYVCMTEILHNSSVWKCRAVIDDMNKTTSKCKQLSVSFQRILIDNFNLFSHCFINISRLHVFVLMIILTTIKCLFLCSDKLMTTNYFAKSISRKT